MRLKNSVVLITGASSGIGEATAMAFAKRGARLALCARRLGRLQAVARRCREAGSPKVTTKRVDVSRRAEARGFVAAALRDFERIDILVNNAGLGWAGPLVEMPEEKARALIDTNLLGVVWTTQAALTAMIAARAGVIINVSSIAGVRATPYSALYSATKHAVAGLSHALRGELSGTGVKVCTVYPAVTASEFFTVSGGRAVGPVYPATWVANLIVRTARFPRRDAMVFPFRVAHFAEPFLGGLIDHVVGEVRRKAEPEAAR
ncbi:MAG: SDR family NAD(P)-dependent oxidoreductase [Candidatus Dormibacteraeota bacterium]|nr:SDR family NAD(P)-dependent oxidoreductase [Candidatus Dormibacteraeota bacterium]